MISLSLFPYILRYVKKAGIKQTMRELRYIQKNHPNLLRKRHQKA